jgi:T5SS/PEP-CTERM-associated repeat protein
LSSAAGHELLLGAWGRGDLTVSNGAHVTADNLTLGGFDVNEAQFDPNMLRDFGPAAGTGTATVTGSGSQVSIDQNLTVGYRGTGTLNIENGGQVTVGAKAYIGGGPIRLAEGQEFSRDMLPTGTGTVTVAGRDSTLTVTDNDTLFIGYSGTGTLEVNTGGGVVAASTVIGAAPDANGTLVVSDVGSTFSAGDEMDVGAWGTGHITVSNGGHVTAGNLYVGGFDSSGVSDLPQRVLDNFGLAAGTGTVTVDQGGQIDVSGQAYIGYSGTGTANVTAGGQVVTFGTVVGALTGSSGQITVDGPDSLWIADYNEAYELATGEPSGQIFIGKSGQGQMTISNGGEVAASDMLSISGDTEGMTPLGVETPPTGTVTVIGQDSTLSVGELLVGATGIGTLNILDNASVNSHAAGIGVAAGSHGEVLVSNAPGSWTNLGSIFVGGYGEGALTVAAGGHVSTGNTLYIGGFDPDVFATDRFYNGTEPNGTGTVTVTGQDSLVQAFGVGIGGEGTLEILNGGRLESQIGVVGAGASGNGTVVVDGNDSTWYLGGSGGSAAGRARRRPRQCHYLQWRPGAARWAELGPAGG